ncbi:hypothetical protein SK571_00815 [Lentzea sp. BCCO 10_0798]|uniref:MarR family transcriptional regulator n=1 Tax=Lentzea kristufekii TaxID=3095430 RepID=A0ABU4TII8_9PSEU|nr:hypothetical protein [Lentzea sp. BCCO 10_0798]MDX8047908.1 hypothetical protein [Lentzea sp. BCCO 10_0798]
MTGAHADFGPLPQVMAPNRTRAQLYLLAEGTGEVRDLLARNGFSELTAIRTFRWAPEAEPRTTRPIRPIGAVEYQDLLDRFQQKFDVEPEDSLCAGLLAEVSEQLDALIPRLRTGGEKN